MEFLSLVTTPITLLKENKIISHGSGFFYSRSKENERYFFLITNYHVLTGFSPQNKHAPKGDEIEFIVHENDNSPNIIKRIKYPLFTSRNDSVWILSRKYENADVAVIPIGLNLKMLEGITLSVISDNYIDKDIEKYPTTQVTIIGYPYHFFDLYNYLPIYKTGHIASEPDYDFQNSPIFLVDVSNYPGMSGSPVFIINKGTWKPKSMEGIVRGYIRELLGVFSSNIEIVKQLPVSKIYSNPIYDSLGVVIKESLELGVVWKSNVISDIIDNFDSDKYQKEIINFIK